VNLVALAEDCAGAEKSHARHDLSGDSRRVCRGVKDLEAEPREQAGPDSDQPEGLDSGGMAAPLTLQADGDREDCCDEQAKGEIYVAEEWQLLSLYPAGRRVGSCCAVPQGTQEGQAGRGC